MLTLRRAGCFEEVIKKSRFIAHAEKVTSQAESLAFFESVADSQASHNCWAWRIDYKVRSSDDGEPSGTAGRPILSVIEGRKLENVMVIVTRNFGGIKLGVGGLVRAYSGTAAKCLDRIEVIEQFPMSEYFISAGFEWTSSVHNILSQFSAEKLHEEFEETGAVFKIRCRESDFLKLADALRDSTRGQVAIQKA
jgi:uncharacterized YigZ family protein